MQQDVYFFTLRKSCENGAMLVKCAEERAWGEVMGTFMGLFLGCHNKLKVSVGLSPCNLQLTGQCHAQHGL